MKPGGHSFRTAATLFLLVLLIYSVCPPFTSNDSYFVVPTALSLLRHGTTAVDEFVPGAPAQARYAVECVPEQGTAVAYGSPCPNGHWYNFYPVGVAVLALPVVAVLQVVTSAIGAAVPNLSASAGHPVLAAFFRGDLAGGNAVAQLAVAAIMGAASALLVFLSSARFLPWKQAAGLALLFAFGTSQFSVSSRNLFQHGPSVLMLCASLYLLLLAEDDRRVLRYAAVPLAFAFIVRPSNFIAVAALTAFVAVHHRKQIVPFLVWSLPVATPFFALNLITRHSLLPTYYHADAAGRMPFGSGFWMNLVSPSRGLLVFTPVVLFSAVGMVLAVRRRWCWPLAPYLIAIVVLHMFFIASYWAGHSYGPRYWSDMMPLFVFFLIPGLEYWRQMAGWARPAVASVFVVLAAWGVFVHARGATSVAAQQWNISPVNVDEARERVSDWNDPQFLRGLK